MNTGLLKQILALLFIYIIVIFLNSCKSANYPSHYPDELPNPATIIPESQTQFQGDLEKRLNAILANKYATECDKRNVAEKLELARALDQKKNDLKTYFESITETEKYIRVPLGPTYAMKLRKIEPPTYTWESFSFNWLQLYTVYSKIKSQPISNDWIALSSLTERLVMNDTMRLSGRPYSYDNTFAPLSEKIMSATKKCIDDVYCAEPVFSRDIINYLESNTNLISAFYFFNKQKSNYDEKRNYLKWLYNAVYFDFKYYNDFEKNPYLKRLDETTFELSLNPGPFKGYENEFQNYTEDVWRNDNKRITLRWVDSNAISNMFKLSIFENIDAPASVDINNKILNFVPGMDTKAIAHEMGHVIGFRDRYYETFSYGNCTYTQYANGADIMSDHTSGIVTPDEWNTLDRMYPLN